jgi:outer membrane protein TolC
MALTLEDAVQIALEQSTGVKLGQLKVEEARAARDAARSGFFPQVSLDASYTYMSYAPTISQLTPVAVDTSTFELIYQEFEIDFGYPHNFNFGVSVSQTLFTWGKLRNAYGLASSNLRAAELDYEGTLEDVRAATKQAYDSALLAERYLELVREIQAELEAHYEAARDRYEAGLTSDLEVMRAEVQLNNVKPELLQAQTASEVSVDALKLTVGIPQETEIELLDDLEYVPYEADLDSLIEYALENRHDIRAGEKRLDMLGKASAIQRAGDKPTLFANWSYNYGKPYGFSDDWDGSWTATVGLSFPLFDGFKAQAKGRESGAQVRQLRRALELQKEAAILEITTAWKSLEKARESLLAQEDNVDLARRTFEMFEEQYTQGFVSSLDVLDAEVMYSQARLGYISALQDYRVSRAKLDLAVRGGSSSTSSESTSATQEEPASESGGSMGRSSTQSSPFGMF